MNKNIKLPKESFIDDKDAESLVELPTDDDVEGHRVAMNTPEDFTVLPSPPGLGLNRSPGHGGEARDSSDDDSR